MMKKVISLVCLIAAGVAAMTAANPKTEFRGAWLHTVHQGQYASQSTEENKAYLRNQLDLLKNAGVNAVIFQVRPSADAFYPSALEPWSRFLSGEAGVAPSPEWDPLQFMIDESHARGMELHAWLNPYRVTTTAKQTLPKNHIYHKHPERFVTYDKKLYFDPGLPENREFINDVVRDIVTRYDVDAIHMDDYFYPYPVAGVDFPDSASYKKYGKGMKLGDWRRKNVDMLIEGLHQTIVDAKPWVRLGISPFGVWRNKSTDPRGSETKALQNYDDLYADVLLWTEKGWVDYMLPQLYWELEHNRASYIELVKWWETQSNGRHMYIGQDVAKTMTLPDLAPSTEKTQLRHKIELARAGKNIHGNCWWPGYSITKNVNGVADSLSNEFQSTIALIPSYGWICDETPAAPTSLEAKDGRLTWKSAQPAGKVGDTVKFVIYHLPDGDAAVAMNDPVNIVDVVYGNEWSIPSGSQGRYFVTALDRVNNESLPSSTVEVK